MFLTDDPPWRVSGRRRFRCVLCLQRMLTAVSRLDLAVYPCVGCLTASFSNATNSTGAAGDSAVIFSESTTHGTLPWTANYERRCVLYRFTPKNAHYPSKPDATPPSCTQQSDRRILFSTDLDLSALLLGSSALIERASVSAPQGWTSSRRLNERCLSLPTATHGR